MNNRLFRLYIFLLSLLIIAGCNASDNNQSMEMQQKTISIGAVLPLTGEVSSWGEDSAKGIDLAIKHANKNPSPVKFEMVYVDSKGKASEAVSGIQRLLTVDKVVAVIGDNVSGPTIAMIPYINKRKIPLISPSASSPKLSGMSKYFFRVYPSDTAEGSVMAKVAADRLGIKRMAVLYVNNDFGVGLNEIFENQFRLNGGEITESLSYNEDQTDFRPYLIKAIRTKPEGIYLAGYYKDGGAILRQAKELGVKVVFLGSTTHEDPELITIAKEAANGLIYPSSTGYDPNSLDDTVLAFKKSFYEEYKKEPGLVAALGYDCAMLLIRAVKDVGGNSQKIRDYLSNVKKYDGVSGEITFDGNGDVHKPVVLKTVRDGEFIPWEGDGQ